MQRLERSVAAKTETNEAPAKEPEMDPLMRDIVMSLKGGAASSIQMPMPCSAKKARAPPQPETEVRPGAARGYFGP